jgi:hypothetical protein
MKPFVLISSITLVRQGNAMIVWAELPNGQTIEIIREYSENPDHTVYAPEIERCMSANIKCCLFHDSDGALRRIEELPQI